MHRFSTNTRSHAVLVSERSVQPLAVFWSILVAITQLPVWALQHPTTKYGAGNLGVRIVERTHSRRRFLVDASSVLSIGWATPATATTTTSSSPSGNEDLIEIYFGCGCFWHVQHEFVEAERKILDRINNEELTSRAGYAGGLGGTDDKGRVCYHNGRGVADYGRLGHAEVVSIKLPPSKFYDFCAEYCKLFRNGYRADQVGDRGSEYRNLVAFSGGIDNHILLQQLLEASKKEGGDQLDFAAGKGNDDDIARLVWIMDLEKFPFYKGERYHQFHDGFMKGENYPESYNRLIDVFVNEDFGSCPPRL